MQLSISIPILYVHNDYHEKRENIIKTSLKSLNSKEFLQVHDMAQSLQADMFMYFKGGEASTYVIASSCTEFPNHLVVKI